MAKNNEVTVDSIRESLRDDIVHISLFATMFSIERCKEQKEAALMSADNLARFGVNAGLITLDECKDWQGAIHNNNPLMMDVHAKWSTKAAEDSEESTQ